MWEETGLRIGLTRLVGVFGGPEYVVHYRNGHRTSYVITVFEATAPGRSPAPDGTELLEVRFVSREEANSLSLALWMPEVLGALFSPGPPFFRIPE